MPDKLCQVLYKISFGNCRQKSAGKDDIPIAAALNSTKANLAAAGSSIAADSDCHFRKTSLGTPPPPISSPQQSLAPDVSTPKGIIMSPSYIRCMSTIDIM